MNEIGPSRDLLDRRSFLALVAMAAASPLVTCTGQPLLPVDRPTVKWFTADSFWNKPLPDDAPLDPRSEEFVGWLRANTGGFLLAGLDGNRWGVPCFDAGDGDRSWGVSLGESTPQTREIVSAGLRAPELSTSALTGTPDSPLVILDPGRGYQVALWQTGFDGSRFIAETASIYWRHSNGLALGDANPDGDPRNDGHRGVAPSTMLVRRIEVAERRIDHVLKVAIPGTAQWHVRPMVGHEPDRGGVIGQGMRLRIRADLDLERSDLSEEGLVIARALQRYGAIVGDNSGSRNVVLKVEQDIGQWAGANIAADSLAAIPMDALVFVRAGWEPDR
jgi:hypothetical protein